MDLLDLNARETAAYTLTRQRIVSQIDNIETKGGSAGTLKRLKRFGNAFSWYPQFYQQILEDIGGMTDKQLMSALRTEEGFMKLMAPVKGLPIHHIFASRTGGDMPIRTPTNVFLDVRKRVYNDFGFGPGNNPENLGAQGAVDERMHQGRFGSKGTVFEESKGYGMAPTKEVPSLHGEGTRNIGGKLGQDPALLRGQSDEIYDALKPFLDQQLATFNKVTAHPILLKQRSIIQEGIDPAAFDVGRTTEQSTAVRKAAEKTGLDIKYASAFDFSKATATLMKNPFFKKGLVVAGAIPFFGTSVGAATVEMQAAARDEEIAANPNDPTLQVNKTLDQISGWGDRTSLAGMAASATGAGAVAGIPMVAAGEGVSLVASGASMVLDFGRFITNELNRGPQQIRGRSGAKRAQEELEDPLATILSPTR